MNKNQLIDQLIGELEQQALRCQHMKTVGMDDLSYRRSTDAWNALECVEHLRRYSEYYLPAIERTIAHAGDDSSDEFRSTFLGNYFVKMMDPNAKGMKTFASKNPLGSVLDRDVISVFEAQLQTMKTLLEAARGVNLSKNKVRSTLPLVRFNLGDTFRFVIKHNERHLLQAQRAYTH